MKKWKLLFPVIMAIFFAFSASIVSAESLGDSCVFDSDCDENLVCDITGICNASDEDAEDMLDDLFDDLFSGEITINEFTYKYGVISGNELTDEEMSELLELIGYSNVFPDVNGHKYETAINYIAAEDIVHGNPDGTYKPDNEINRAEFLTIIIEAVYPGEATGSGCFPDVSNEWYAKNICFAKSKGIVSGYPDGTFGPGNNINLAEASAIIAEAFGIKTDESVGTQWYEKFLDALEISNMDINQDASHKITRGEMAEIIYNLMKSI